MAHRETSDRQKKANQRNAQKSTGPKTEAGKNQSRQNAWRHGLTAEKIVLANEEHQRREALAVWSAEIGPHSKAEREVIDRVARANVKLERSKQFERDHLAPHLHEVNQDWERRKKHRARGQAARLKTKPASALRSLQKSAFGCDYLKKQWQQLADALIDQAGWTADQQAQALRLTGRDPESPPGPSDPDGQTLFQAARQLSDPRTTRVAGASQPRGPGFPSLEGWGLAEADEAPATQPDSENQSVIPNAKQSNIPNAKSGEDQTAKEDEHQQARQFWLDWIAAEQARLTELEDRLWDEVDGPERKAVLSEALIDGGPAGRHGERYEQRAETSLHRNIKLLIQMRETRFRADDRRERISKDMIMPKEYIGDGWWREPGSCPAPPGFIRAEQEWHAERHQPFEPFYAGNPDLDWVDPERLQPFECTWEYQDRLGQQYPPPLGNREGYWHAHNEARAWYQAPDAERPHSTPPKRGPANPWAQPAAPKPPKKTACADASGPTPPTSTGSPSSMPERENDSMGESMTSSSSDPAATEGAPAVAPSAPNEPNSPAQPDGADRPKSKPGNDLGQPISPLPINAPWRNRRRPTGATGPDPTAPPSASDTRPRTEQRRRA